MVVRFTCVLTIATLAAAWAAETSSLDGLVAAERAFSAHCVEHGMKEAFTSYLADDGILFRPGPVNGQQMWSRRPEVKGTLIWEPSFAEVSASGDFGVTLGPWEFRPPKGERGEVGHGTFVSAWRRDGDGPWRVALDIGVSHPKPERGLGRVKLATGPTHAPPKHEKVGRSGFSVGVGILTGNFGVGVGSTTGGTERDYEYRRTAHEIHTMMSAERSLGWYLKAKGPAKAYQEVGAGDLRFLRNGSEPTLGVESAAAGVESRGRDVAFETRGQAVSKSWDMGYSYGLVTARAKGAPRADTSAFVHLWRKDDAGDWKLIVDIENEFPEHR
jgi:ketosteroid isomerase-like protein